MKECVICKLNKELSCFYKDERYLYGVKSQCKTCYNLKRKEKSRVYFEKNKDKIYLKHKEYRAGAKERILIKHKEWINNNRDRIRHTDRLWRNKNKDRCNSNRKNWIEKNKKTFRDRVNSNIKNRKKQDASFRIACNLRTRIWDVLNRREKKDNLINFLGCTINELKFYLESKFKEGMSWDNYGRTGWHIDHIKPCASFDLSKEEEQRRCFHYTNLQPLWAKENLIKKDKI